MLLNLREGKEDMDCPLGFEAEFGIALVEDDGNKLASRYLPNFPFSLSFLRHRLHYMYRLHSEEEGGGSVIRWRSKLCHNLDRCSSLLAGLVDLMVRSRAVLA